MPATLKGFSIEQFREEGYSGPVRVMSESDAASLRAHFFREIGQAEAAPGPTKAYMSAWHLKHRWSYELATLPSILDLIEEAQGPDMVLWAMHFWYKEPHNSKRIPWHQDGQYWPIRPIKNVTAWVALGPTFKANGCLRIVPGTHKRMLEHLKLNDPTSGFAQGLPKEAVDESKAVDLEMQPGEAVIFNEAVFHGSECNTSDVARVAISMRYTTPEVKILIDEWSDPDRIRTLLVRGEDRPRLNEAIRGTPPAK